jgi:hypothetical protein
MNLDINKIIDDHGQQIANQLRIATEQVYDKVMWYIRIEGAVTLVKMALYGVWAIILFFIMRWYIRASAKWEIFEGTDQFGRIMCGFMLFAFGGLIGGMIWGGFINGLITAISMIAAPEYYLIHQIVENIGK